MYLLNTMFNSVARKIVAKIANNKVSMRNYNQNFDAYDENIVYKLDIVHRLVFMKKSPKVFQKVLWLLLREPKVLHSLVGTLETSHRRQ